MLDSELTNNGTDDNDGAEHGGSILQGVAEHIWPGGRRWCAEGETRTLTGVRPRRPEHRVSANSTTSAGVATHRAALEGLLFT